jgi:hypothetical protein
MIEAMIRYNQFRAVLDMIRLPLVKEEIDIICASFRGSNGYIHYRNFGKTIDQSNHIAIYHFYHFDLTHFIQILVFTSPVVEQDPTIEIEPPTISYLISVDTF